MYDHNVDRHFIRTNDQIISDMKTQESPKFENGRLLPQKPLRHKLPKKSFYYSNREWFKDNTACQSNNATCGSNTSASSAVTNPMKSVTSVTSLPKINKSGSIVGDKDRDAEGRKLLAPTLDNNEITNLPEDFSSQEYNQMKESKEIPAKAYMETYIRRDAAKWKSTPVPGFRTCAHFDRHREESVRNYKDIYEKKRGVLPKYGGYVPGLKFRYGSPFGQLTYNARELGMEKNKSRTWGGTVSLF